MVPLISRGFIVAACLRSAADAARLTSGEEFVIEANVTERIDPLGRDPLARLDRLDRGDAEAGVHHLMEANIQVNKRCSDSVQDAVIGHRSECKCDGGSYVAGESPACLQGQRRNHFSVREFQGEGCRCEDQSYTMCSSMVEGSVLRNSDHPDSPCKCLVGSFLTGNAEECRTAERLRKFDPREHVDCHCSWNYDHVPDWRDHIQAFWRDIMTTSNPNGIEPRCQPFIEGPGHRGIVLLMHGATACSGWWYLVKEPLIAAGWMVVSTTHIGHGRAPEMVHGEHWSVTDYTQEMPTSGQPYIDYADELNKVMKKYRRDHPDKEMVLVGHSIGGAMATNMAIEEPDLWQRLLIMNPFFAPSLLPAFLDRALVSAIMHFAMPAYDWVQNGDTVRWSEGCDAIRLQPNGGHGGMCQFSIMHLRSWFLLGDIVQRKTEAIGSEHGIYAGSVGRRIRGLGHRVWTAFDGVETTHSGLHAQILTTLGDGAVENSNIHYLERVFEAWAGSSQFCVLPREFSHSWACPIDFPWLDHWWLDAGRVSGGITAIGHIARFLTDETPVPVRDTVTEAMGDLGLVGDNLCDVHHAR